MKIVISIAILSLLLICWGCTKSDPKGKSASPQITWMACKTLEEILPHLKNEKVESISFCDGDPDINAESWYVFEKVPKDQLQMLAKFLSEEVESGIEALPGEAHNQMPWSGVMKLITDKGNFIAPVPHVPEDGWHRRITLVGLWPRLQKEKIESISFCREEVGTDIDSWDCWNVPKEKLDECIRIIGLAMQNADPNDFKEGPIWQGKMKIVTDKRKYIVRAESAISDATTITVYGNEWSSPELGMFLQNCGFLAPDPKKTD